MVKNILGIIALLFIIGTLFSDNFGFVTITGAESIGFNASTVFVYLGGGWLIYRALKKKKQTD